MFCVKSISQSEVCATDLMNLMNLMNCGFGRRVCTWRFADRQETTRAVIKWRSNMAHEVGVSVAPTYNHAVCTPRWAVDAQVFTGYYFILDFMLHSAGEAASWWRSERANQDSSWRFIFVSFSTCVPPCSPLSRDYTPTFNILESISDQHRISTMHWIWCIVIFTVWKLQMRALNVLPSSRLPHVGVSP